MEEERKILFFLEQIPQPGFLIREGRIQDLNQAAQALLLTSGEEFLPLLHTGSEEYTQFREGQISLTVSIAGKQHQAVITQMADAQLVLLDTDETLDEFRSMALTSMQLRQPLMQAIACAQKQPADSKLNHSLMQMLRLVSNMSDISRYSASARMETRDADGFLRELFEKAQSLTEGRISLTFEGLKQPVFMLVDPEQLERAVWNILSNCIKFLPQQGCIHASLTRRNRFLQLTIEDNGSGIAEQVRSTLFQRYLRQPGIEDNRYGLGLGMAIVRTVAANHSGTVLVTPSGTSGTRITMTLAIRQDSSTTLRCPVLRPDYSGGFDHALVELSDCLPAEFYQQL